MEAYVWLAAGGLVLLVIALYVVLGRARAKAEAGLSPEELEKKRVLENMADRLSP